MTQRIECSQFEGRFVDVGFNPYDKLTELRVHLGGGYVSLNKTLPLTEPEVRQLVAALLETLLDVNHTAECFAGLPDRVDRLQDRVHRLEASVAELKEVKP